MADTAYKLNVPSFFALSRASPLRMIRVWLRYRRNLDEVAGLDERMLSDIGANRTELLNDAWRDANGERCTRGM